MSSNPDEKYSIDLFLPSDAELVTISKDIEIAVNDANSNNRNDANDNNRIVFKTRWISASDNGKIVPSDEAVAALAFSEGFATQYAKTGARHFPVVAMMGGELPIGQDFFRMGFSTEVLAMAIGCQVLQEDSGFTIDDRNKCHYILIRSNNPLGDTFEREFVRRTTSVVSKKALSVLRITEHLGKDDTGHTVAVIYEGKEFSELKDCLTEVLPSNKEVPVRIVIFGYWQCYNSIIETLSTFGKSAGRNISLYSEPNYLMRFEGLNKEKLKEFNEVWCIAGKVTRSNAGNGVFFADNFKSFARESVRLLKCAIKYARDLRHSGEEEGTVIQWMRNGIHKFLRQCKFYQSECLGAFYFRDDGELFLPLYIHDRLFAAEEVFSDSLSYGDGWNNTKESVADKLGILDNHLKGIHKVSVPGNLKIEDGSSIYNLINDCCQTIADMAHAVHIDFINEHHGVKKIFFQWQRSAESKSDPINLNGQLSAQNSEESDYGLAYFADKLAPRNVVQLNMVSYDLEDNNTHRFYCIVKSCAIAEDIRGQYEQLYYTYRVNDGSMVLLPLCLCKDLFCKDGVDINGLEALIIAKSYLIAKAVAQDTKSAAAMGATYIKNDIVNKSQIEKFFEVEIETRQNSWKDDKFVYYIPASTESELTGGIIVSTDRKIPLFELQVLSTMVSHFFSVLRGELSMGDLRVANTKSAIGSIMSRNGSHNIGSHVLAALSHNVGTLPDDRVLYQYIQQRMDYIATVTTDFPTWTQPTMFVADMMKTFLSQRHLLDHIVESEGLRAFQFQNPNMDDDEWFDQKNCIQIHVRRVGADGEDGIDIIRYDSKDDRTKPLDLKQDIALSIPGGIVGEHAFYTILENIIRNAAKHSWVSPSLDRKKYSNLKLYIDFWTTNNDSKVNFKIFARVPLNTEESDKTQGSSDSQKIGQLVDKFDSSQGLTNEDQNAFDSLPIDCRQQIMLARRLIDSHGALRRENWGLAEMKISAGYLAGKEFDVIGGLKKSESEIIKPCVIEESKAFASEENKDAKEKYLGYTFTVEKPKEILIVVESLEGWNAEALKEYGIFVKTVAEITNDEQSRRLNYRLVVHYDARQLFDNEKRPKNGILLPFRILSGKNVDEKYKTFIPQISFIDLKNAFNTNGDAIAKKNAVEKIVYGTYLKHLLEQRNKENQEKKIEKIGLLVAINENEKAGGNSLISDVDILELMLEQNFATCVDQYKAFVAGDDCKKIMRSLELIRCKSSDESKVLKFKKIKWTSTTKELIAQRIYDWMKLAGDDKDDIKEHLRKKYFVREKTDENYTDNFDDMVNALLAKHPIDDFIRYVEVIFENTKKLFKQYEEQIVTLPAGYKVETSEVEDGKVFIDGLEIITKAGAIEKDTDRHWIGYRRHAHTIDVEDSAKSLYVEPLSGTQTYLSDLAKVKNDLSLQMRLAENGLMRILVLDERVAKFLREHQKEVGPHYKAMNINVIDHEWVEGNNGDAPDGFYKAFTKDTKDALDQFVKSEEKNSSELSEFTDVDILIVHQGILDKWFAGFKSDKEKMRKLLEGFKKLVKYVVVTTGRGTPENIPEEAHLLPFAVVESTLFKKYPEKLILTDTIMNVLPVGKKNDNSGGQE